MRPRPGRLGAVVLAVFLALALAGVLAPAFGWRLDVVQSGSMSPSIKVGDLVITSPQHAEVQVGDVICFRSGGVLVCHRVVSIDETNETIVTKGDANEDPDPSPVSYDDVMGTVVLNIPLLGYVISFLRSPFGWALIILLAFLALVIGGEGKDPDRKRTKPREGEE